MASEGVPQIGRFCNLGVLVVGVLIMIRALLVGVDGRAPDLWELPISYGPGGFREGSWKIAWALGGLSCCGRLCSMGPSVY